MKEYCTLCTQDVSYPHSLAVHSRKESRDSGQASGHGKDFDDSTLTRLGRTGWTVIASAISLPSCQHSQPQYHFVLEREVPSE